MSSAECPSVQPIDLTQPSAAVTPGYVAPAPFVATPDKFYPEGLTDSEKWRLTYRDLEMECFTHFKAHYLQMLKKMSEQPEVPMHIFAQEFQRKCVVTLGGWLGVAKVLNILRHGFRAPPRKVLMLGTQAYVMAAMNNYENAHYLFERYEGVEQIGRAPWQEVPFVAVRCMNVNHGGVSMSSEFYPCCLTMAKGALERHFRYYRRSFVQHAIAWVNSRSPPMCRKFEKLVASYRL